MQCQICLENYNIANRIPRNLNCGHTYCEKCLKKIGYGYEVECPKCRQRSKNNLPICYAIYDKLFIENISDSDNNCKKILFYCDKDQTDICIMCTQTTHKGHPISSLKEKHIAEENNSSLKKWRNFFNAKKEEFSIKKNILQNLIDEIENKKIFLSKNLSEKYEFLIEEFEKDKKNLSEKLGEIYCKEKNLMQLTKSKIDKQAIKLRSYIAEMECLSHDLNSLPNEEILEIDLGKLSLLNNETSNIIYESVKNKNTNFCFKDFNSVEECFLNKKEINLVDYLNDNRKIFIENKRKDLREKINKEKLDSKNEQISFDENNNNEIKEKLLEENLKKNDSLNYNENNEELTNDFKTLNTNENICELKKDKSNKLTKLNSNDIKQNNLIDLNNSYMNLTEQNDINNLSYSNSVFINQNNDTNLFPINSFVRKSSFNNNEIRNETTINFIPYSAERKKSENSVMNKYTKSLERQYISNLNNNNANMNYKIKRNKESEKSNYENYINQTGFYNFDSLNDLILFIGDSKDKSILLFNKKNFFWKKLENCILGEYEFLDYCCLTKFSENSYLISGGCVYSNYKNTVNNLTYLVKIINNNENFLISFLPFRPMNKARFSHGSCLLRKKTYLFGGHDGTQTLNCIEYFDPKDESFKYVYEEGSHSAENKILSEMNIEREIFASCVVNDRFIYIFGGFNDVHLDSIEKFDVENGMWKILSVKLNSSLQNATACFLGNNEVVIIGGYNGSLQRGIEVFDVEKNTITNNLNDMKLIIPRRRAHCFKLGKKVIILNFDYFRY